MKQLLFAIHLCTITLSQASQADIATDDSQPKPTQHFDPNEDETNAPVSQHQDPTTV